MKLEKFITILNNNPDKALLFEYAPQVYAGTNYHITELKTIDIKSVDCGGKSHAWTETIMQLWENPKEIGKTNYLDTSKALQILNKVHGIQPLELDTEIKVEYGNAIFHTANLTIENTIESEKQLIVQLHSENTLCKAPELCGVPEPKEAECCTPSSGCC
jgi:hypothetical protein